MFYRGLFEYIPAPDPGKIFQPPSPTIHHRAAKSGHSTPTLIGVGSHHGVPDGLASSIPAICW